MHIIQRPIRTHVDDGVAKVALLPEEDVGGARHEASHRHVGQQVVLLQGHVGQTQVTLHTQGRGHHRAKLFIFILANN